MVRKINIPFFLYVLSFFLQFTSTIFAGGGRIEIFVLDTFGVATTQTVRVKAKISKEDYSGVSVGEKAEFRLVNPRPGDYCTTTSSVSDTTGMIYGECGASQAGGLTMYVHSLDKNEDTYTVFFQIHEAVRAAEKTSPTSTPTTTLPVVSPAPPEIVSPLPTPSASPFSPMPSLSPTPLTPLTDRESGVDQAILVLILSGLAGISLAVFFVMYAKSNVHKGLACVAGMLLLATVTTYFVTKHGWGSKEFQIEDTTQFTTSPEVSPAPEEPFSLPQPTPTPSPAPSTVPSPLPVTVTLKGIVYNDENCNYIYDAGEMPMPHVQVSIYQFQGKDITELSRKTYGEDGKYSYSTTLSGNETLVLQPGPYRQGYSVVAMSGLPQQVHVSKSARVVEQNIPMIDNARVSSCR